MDLGDVFNRLGFGAPAASSAAGGAAEKQEGIQALDLAALKAGPVMGIRRRRGENSSALACLMQMATVSPRMMSLLRHQMDDGEKIQGRPIEAFYQHYQSLQANPQDKSLASLRLEFLLADFETLTGNNFKVSDKRYDPHEIFSAIFVPLTLGQTFQAFTIDVEDGADGSTEKDKALSCIDLDVAQPLDEQFSQLFASGDHLSIFKEVPAEIMFRVRRVTSDQPFPMRSETQLSIPFADFTTSTDYECIAFVGHRSCPDEPEHYLTYLKKNDGWYETDDGRVTHLTPAQADERMKLGYLYCYEQKNLK